MGMSDRIEAFIMELLKDESPDEWLELKRNELASVFGCVPSQINYVIATRFSPERGYVVESRRGGGGYLRIKRMDCENNAAAKVIGEIGESLDYVSAREYVSYLVRNGAADEGTAKLMLAAVSDSSLAAAEQQKDKLRAKILKNMLAAI